jgi:hypothetical protein
MAEIVVRLLAGDDEEKSFLLSREFSSDVARLSGVVSHAPPAAAPEPGKKGDLFTMGAIFIAAVSGGGALTALVNTIGSYLARDHRTEVEIQTSDGRKVRIPSQGFKRAELEETLRRLLDMAKGRHLSEGLVDPAFAIHAKRCNRSRRNLGRQRHMRIRDKALFE